MNTNENVNKKNMIAKGRPTTDDTEEIGKEQFLCSKLFQYAKELRKRLDVANEMRGLEKVKTKYDGLNWMLGKIEKENTEYVQIIRSLTQEDHDSFAEQYKAECDCRLQCDGEDLSKLDVFVDMILKESERELECEEYESWLRENINGHCWSTFLLSVLVRKLEAERKDAYTLLESFNHHHDNPPKERVGNIINMYGGGSYTDVHGNTNVTLNIATGMKSEPDSGGEEIKQNQEEDLATGAKNTLPESRQAILEQLLDLADNGDWVKDIQSEDIKTMLRTVLGVGEKPLTAKEREMSATLWDMLEKGRGNDRVKITWQNMVGYFADRKLFNKNGSPSLNEDFFGTKNDYSNIDKGRPSNDSNGDNMPPRFRKVLPLLDKHVPKLKNASK